MEEPEIITEFVIESSENLGRLDREMVELEGRPEDAELLASVFRTIHTIKGTCGFLGFQTLERITHHTENILSQIRNGDRRLTPELVSLILETVDAVKAELTSIEATSAESGAVYEELLLRQEAAYLMDRRDVAVSSEPLDDAFLQPVSETASASPERISERINSAADCDSAVPDAGSGPKSSTAADSTIRVDVSLLDKLMNLVGELVLARNQVLQFSARQEDASLLATSQRLNLITTELQASVMKTRMQPIGMVWGKLPRVVRDLAITCGKQITLEMDGADTELDKTIIEAIKDPLTHIVRNSGDHGIERPEVRIQAGKPAQGKLALRAFHEGGNVNIEISDDGAGIDPQKVKASALQKGLLQPDQVERLHDRDLVNLVFLPGFSTAHQVSNISGRGVGMDVVKTNIEKIGGTVDLASRSGQGTVVKIKIPLTLAIIPGLVVTSGGERFVIPQVNLLELIRLEGDGGRKQVEQIHGTPVYRRRGKLLPLAYLNRVLKIDMEEDHADANVINIVVLRAEDRQFGLIVDGINDTQEIVVKPLGKQLKKVIAYAGATIMGDGKVALILDVTGIARLSGVISESRSPSHAEEAELAETSQAEKQSLLLFRAGSFDRVAVPLSMVARLEEFPLTAIEHASGRMVVQYRSEILPLVAFPDRQGTSESRAKPTQNPVQVVVFADGDRRIGLLVDQILDIVEDTVTIKKASDYAGLLGSAVVGQKVTDFLDLHAVIEHGEGDWFRRQKVLAGATVLVTDSSAFARNLLRNHLEMAGHRVVEAGTAHEAMASLGKSPIDIVVTALDLPDRSAFQLLESIGKEPDLRRIPVVALTSDAGEADASEDGAMFADCLKKFDRPAMLRSLERLSSVLNGAGEQQAGRRLATVRG